MTGLKPKKKFQSHNRRYVAQKEFTDRELPKETFNRNLDELSYYLLTGDDKYKVLVYYGIGGIGKTSLKNELKKSILDDRITATVALEIDFREVRSRECANGLLDLYNSLKQNSSYSKISFPHFELAYAIYFRRKNPDIVYNGKENGVMKFVDLGLKIFGLTNILDFGLSAFLTKEDINKAYDKIKSLTLNKDRKEDLIAFSDKSITDMEEDLILFFADDLQNYLIRHNPLKIVIFIDTFEALLGNEMNNLKRIEKAEWVQQLILNLPNILFVITGRDKIAWGKEWDSVLDQHLISELSHTYSMHFLDKCGIEEDEIKGKIVNYSGGHPYYLDLSVDTYFSLKNENKHPTVGDFGTTKKEILGRFITSLNTIELELLKVMTVPNYYNREIFKYLIDQFKISYAATQFDDFNQYSFINFNETLNRFTLHQLMRKGMEEYINEHSDNRATPTFLETVNEKLWHYFDNRYQENKRENIYESIYHRLRLGKPDTFFDWLNEEKIGFMKTLQVFGDTVLLNNIFEQINCYYKINEFSIELFNIYEDMIHLAGNYKESVDLAEKFLEQFTKEEILTNKRLIKLKYRIIHHKMFFVKADDLIDELTKLRNEISKEDFFEEYCELTYMLGGGVGFLTGEFDQCIAHLNNLIELIGEVSTENSDIQNILVRTKRKLIDYYRIKGDVDIAKQHIENTLDVENLNRYQIYLCCSYADIFRVNNNFDKAIQYFELVLTETKKLGIKGWQAHAYLSLANVYLDKKDLVIAKDYLSQALTIYQKINQKWGIVNSHILHARIALTEDNQNYLTYLEQANQIATEYNYRYEIKQIKWIKEEKKIGQQILLYV